MYTCPNCGQSLSRKESAVGVYWGCDNCGGYAVSMAILRKAVRRECVTEAWAAARLAQGTRGRNCPTCSNPMTEVPVTVGEQTLKLDVCKLCQFFWFDPNELESLPAMPPEEAGEPELPLEARQALAIQQVQLMAERARAEDPSPDAGWKTIPAIFGFPVEADTIPLTTVPWVTWSLAVIIAAVSLGALPHLRSAIADYGLIPAEAFRDYGATFLTSFFLHGGIIHLAGNLYFLLIFGSNVEDCLGRWRFIALTLLATIGGDALHVMSQPHSIVPCVGASGGISGLIAFYALKFPRARLGLLLRFGWVQLPAWGAFVVWVAMQGFGVFLQIAGFSHVAAVAHLGGAAVGLIFWALHGRQQRAGNTSNSAR